VASGCGAGREEAGHYRPRHASRAKDGSMNQDEYKAEQSIQAMRDIWDREFTLPKPAPRCSSSTGWLRLN